jgi:hypothetical protein
MSRFITSLNARSLKLKRKSSQVFSVSLGKAEGSVSPWRSRQIPALAKLDKEPKMRAKPMWEQSSVSGAFSTAYRGIRIKITVDPKTDKPTEISWCLSGKLAESVPVTCSLEIAKRIALEVVDQQIAQDAAWANAEYRHNSDIWKHQ